MLGAISLGYSLVFGASCALGALLGVSVVNWVVRRSGATSLVVFCMTAVVAAGAVICAAYSVPQAARELRDSGPGAGFSPFCQSL